MALPSAVGELFPAVGTRAAVAKTEEGARDPSAGELLSGSASSSGNGDVMRACDGAVVVGGDGEAKELLPPMRESGLGQVRWWMGATERPRMGAPREERKPHRAHRCLNIARPELKRRIGHSIEATRRDSNCTF